MFGAVYAAEGTAREVLDAVAREFSPRVEVQSAREITIDLTGLTRLFGNARTIAEELRRTAADRGLRVRVAIAGTRTAARLLVHHRAGITIVEPGTEATVLASLPLGLLATLHPNHPHDANDPNPPSLPRLAGTFGETGSNEWLQTLRRWGLRTLGELAALPADDVAARLGQEGVRWQRLGRGEDARPLVPALPEERFEQALDLEWPIEGLEPLSFVLGRLMERLSTHLERRGRGAAVLHVRLHLVKTGCGPREIHERSLQLPAPMRDARALRTLALLDLESHPPAAAIERVVVAVDPTPGRVVQYSLLTRPLPSPEQLSTLMARLAALMGEGRCGSPAAIDSWQPGAFAMKPFAPRDSAVADHGSPRHEGTEPPHSRTLRDSVIPWPVDTNSVTKYPRVALRRFRFPVPIRVRIDVGRPVRVTIDRRGMSGGRVTASAGPWRTSGNWWVAHSPHPPHSPHSPHVPHPPQWDRDEWDVTLHDGATYRLFHERDSGKWFLDGIVD